MDREPGAQVIDERPAPKPSRRRSWPWFISIGLLVVLVGVVIVDRRSSDHATLSPADVGSIAKAAVDKGIKDARSAPPDSAVVYQAILPSLVLIRGDTDGVAGGANDLGTGVVINAAGQILTARHVVAGARTIQVTFADGTEVDGHVVSQEPENDIAVLEADQGPEIRSCLPCIGGGGYRSVTRRSPSAIRSASSAH